MEKKKTTRRGQGITLEARFAENVDMESNSHLPHPLDCWIWLGPVFPAGYGEIRESHGKHMGAHRASWIIHRGEIPDGMLVCHICDNRICVNYSHLFLGTHLDNQQDKARKGRQTRGSTHPAARLIEQHIPAIIAAAAAGKTKSELGREYSVDRRTIRRIIQGKSWRHVND